jgi:hypothetical protein
LATYVIVMTTIVGSGSSVGEGSGVVSYGGGVEERGSVVRGSSIMALIVTDDALGRDRVSVSVAEKTSIGRSQEGAESYDLQLKEYYR